MKTINYLSLAGLSCAFFAQTALAETKPERVLYLSGNQTLNGYVYKPQGNGPFPAVIFNQASLFPGRLPQEYDPFPGLAKMFNSQGYVLFVPGRHQVYEDDLTGKAATKDQKLIASHEQHAANIIGALQFLRARGYVDETRVAMFGDSAGAVSTLFAAEQALGISSIIVVSPGTQVLKESPIGKNRLRFIVQNSKIPIFLFQAENDVNLLPREILGSELERKGAPNRVKVYGTYGDLPADSHKLVTEGCAVWQRDVFSFLQQTTERFGARLVDSSGK
jgi:dienelactone hydrolase